MKYVLAPKTKVQNRGGGGVKPSHLAALAPAIVIVVIVVIVFAQFVGGPPPLRVLGQGKMEWFRDRLDALQDRFGYGNQLEEPEEQTLLEQFNEATTLNRTQRLLGFAVCFGMGMLLSMLAPAFILRPVKLATTLTLGNLLSLGSMMFLVGPMKQIQAMFDNKRRAATGIYLASLLVTLLVAFWLKSRLLCLLFILIQYCALVWYSLSYIPYGQAMVLRVLGMNSVAVPGDG